MVAGRSRLLEQQLDRLEMFGVWRPGWPVVLVSLAGRQATVALEHGGLLTLDLGIEARLIADWVYLPVVAS